MPAMHHHIDSIELLFEEALVGLNFQGIRHDALGIREHSVFGDDGVAFDANGKGHCFSREDGQ
jgi:hypothetical protein